MPHQLVQIVNDDSGDETNDPSWHYVICEDGSPRTLCSGEVFGYGEGRAIYKSKVVERGGITCPKCLKKIKHFKEIKL